MSQGACLYLIPSELAEGVVETIPAYVGNAVRGCEVLFVEQARTARRFLKRLCPDIVIDSFEWHVIGKDEPAVIQAFDKALRQGRTVGIISEAGCPGVADPGQMLVERAQQAGVQVKPLVGPSSLLLALMGSGLNGQQFRFHGYLPIDAQERRKAIQKLEDEIRQAGVTQLFIETPYRNDAMLKDLLQYCHPATKLCIAVNLTSVTESVRTQTIAGWRKTPPQALHKQPAIFLLGS